MKTVFDAGAHIGEDIDRWKRDGFTTIIAIEPRLDLCERLRVNFPDVIVVNAAVWSSNGNHDIYFGGYSSLSTLKKERTEHGRFQSYGWEHRKSVRTVTLDTLIEEHGIPDLIKLDIEGAELEALSGLSIPVDIITYEYLAEDIEIAVECARHIEWLDEYIYHIRVGESTTYAKGLSFEGLENHLKEIEKKAHHWGMITATRKYI